jgi:5-methylcytosine-specific restriction protein A
MATSRTGTTKWLRIRAAAIYRAKRAGITHCVECGVELDYEVGLTPRSAEVDHIIPASQGGKDEMDNVRVICRYDNQSLGGKQNRKPRFFPPLRTSREW